MARKLFNTNVMFAFVVLCLLGFFFLNLRRADEYQSIATIKDEIEELRQQLSISKSEYKTIIARLQQNYTDSADAPPPIQQQRPITQPQQLTPQAQDPIIPVVVMSCNRAELLRTTLDALLKQRPSNRFPIIVSQDCDDKAVEDVVVKDFGNDVIMIRHYKNREQPAYDAIAQHYGWALTQVFNKLGYEAAIMVEDDMLISVDFFEYFIAVYPILKQDSSLYCASTWNDNGHSQFVRSSSQLYRTEVFPGLGWMLTREVWEGMRDKWPSQYWDEFMRNPEIRKDRSCIYPEISRNKNNGKQGVSSGQFYEQHIKYIKFNEEFVPFTKLDLSYLLKSNYEEQFLGEARNAMIASAQEVKDGDVKGETVRIIYHQFTEYQNIARSFGLMDDEKEGLPRTSYHKVVPFHWKDYKVFLTPPEIS